MNRSCSDAPQRGNGPSSGPWTVETSDGENHVAQAVVIATGMNKGKLGLPNEDDYEGRGLSHCAHCDGPLYAGLPVIVAGSEGWAKSEAAVLKGLAGEVTVIDSPSRIVALEGSKQRARELCPELEKNEAQMRAYRELPDDELFSEQWVRVPLSPSEFPGYKGERLACARCGEGINFDRFVDRNGKRLCLVCASPSLLYYQPL